ncbi:MAG TPA: sugar nucleotide-binding protein, partial [Candidatus Limnocylindrales bacterium]
MRVAVSGATGRLGRALLAALEEAPFVGPLGPIAWSRPAFDLDEPEAFAALMDRDRPEVVVHAAAWTDVDGCAREPDLALARNGQATGRLADACAERGIDLVIISTNEVFDGARTDGRGYAPDDLPNPINPYGASKLAGEEAARVAYARRGVRRDDGPAIGIV